MANNKKVYVTFAFRQQFEDDEKLAVCCENMEQAMAIRQNAINLRYVLNVRIRKSSKPCRRVFMSYDEYFYSLWYCEYCLKNFS